MAIVRQMDLLIDTYPDLMRLAGRGSALEISVRLLPVISILNRNIIGDETHDEMLRNTCAPMVERLDVYGQVYQRLSALAPDGSVLHSPEGLDVVGRAIQLDDLPRVSEGLSGIGGVKAYL